MIKLLLVILKLLSIVYPFLVVLKDKENLPFNLSPTGEEDKPFNNQRIGTHEFSWCYNLRV